MDASSKSLARKFEPSRNRKLPADLNVPGGLTSQAVGAPENLRCSKNEYVNGFNT